MKRLITTALLLLTVSPAHAAVADVTFTVAMSEPVVVTGCPANCPRLVLDVGGVTRYANFASGFGTASLTFAYSPVAGDVDLDGISITSTSIDLNTSGTISDLQGNALSPLTFTPPITTGLKINYPSLSLDFVNGRYTSNGTATTSLATFLSTTSGSFTRASTATYFDASGIMQTAAVNTPRFDYDPTTLTLRGLLIERSRTNRLLRPSSPTVSPWLIAGTALSVATTTTAPDGSTVNMYNLPTDTALYQDATATIGEVITHSVWVKANMSATIGFRTPGTTNLTNTPINLTPSWQRVELAATATATTTRFLFDNRVASGYGVAGLQLAIFGGQIETGSPASSYIPTTTSAVTRAADDFVLPVGGWYNSAAGTLQVEAMNGTNSATVGLVALHDAATPSNDRLSIIRVSVNQMEAMSRVAGTSAYQTSVAMGGNYTTNKTAFGFATNNFRMAVGGALGALDTTGTLPNVTQLVIGRWNTGSHYDAWIRAIRYYPLRASDAMVQQLTQ